MLYSCAEHIGSATCRFMRYGNDQMRYVSETQKHITDKLAPSNYILKPSSDHCNFFLLKDMGRHSACCSLLN